MDIDCRRRAAASAIAVLLALAATAPRAQALDKGLEAVALNGGEVSEQVVTTVFRGGKPQPLESLNHLTVPFAILNIL